MWGAIAGAALGLGSSIFGGIQAARAAKKQKKILNRQEAENAAWYNRRYNEDGTQRADAQRMFAKARAAMREGMQSARGRQIVAGGTDTAVEAARRNNSDTLAETASRIAANADARKDAVERQYRQTQQGIDTSRANLEAQRATNISQATTGVAEAAGRLGAAIDDNTGATGAAGSGRHKTGTGEPGLLGMGANASGSGIYNSDYSAQSLADRYSRYNFDDPEKLTRYMKLNG